MLTAILALLGWVAFGLVVAFWGGWMERERGAFGKGSERWFD